MGAPVRDSPSWRVASFMRAVSSSREGRRPVAPSCKVSKKACGSREASKGCALRATRSAGSNKAPTCALMSVVCDAPVRARLSGDFGAGEAVFLGALVGLALPEFLEALGVGGVPPLGLDFDCVPREDMSIRVE